MTVFTQAKSESSEEGRLTSAWCPKEASDRTFMRLESLNIGPVDVATYPFTIGNRVFCDPTSKLPVRMLNLFDRARWLDRILGNQGLVDISRFGRGLEVVILSDSDGVPSATDRIDSPDVVRWTLLRIRLAPSSKHEL